MNITRFSLLLCLMIGFGTSAFAEVKAYEDELVIPTWEIGPPQVHSNFFDAGSEIYPYTLNDVLTNNKVDKIYQGVILENEYIKVLVLPEIGGRLHGAMDKTNEYVWFYWQRTIKPGLISMTGAWISGGIEWNFPHGHRPSCFMPVDHRIVNNDDGSATVWVGETEPIFRMRWLVGMTVFPGRSYLRCDYILINPTNHKHSFQFWATSATHANEWAQAQYPGDMVTGHGKHEFLNWPIHDGVDLTWWKNSPNASSYFAFNNPSDWFGVYDHHAQGGTVHVANHHIMPGKKLWTWGSGPSGRIWEDILTEGGGPYFEPQAGAWSDNQPDYHWMWSNEVKTTHDYWYPVRDTRGFHQADKDFAVNTDLQEGKAFAGVYATGVARQHKVVFKNTKSNAILAETVTDISPDKPYTVEVNVGENVSVYDLHLSVYDENENLRIQLQQRPAQKVELPAGQRDPGDPKKMNQDELARSGEWLDKFRRTRAALPYYQEALKKDADDSRVNTEMGFLALKDGKWNDALVYFDKALQRDDDNSRIYFGKGMAYAGLQDFQNAYDYFYRATYAYDYFSPAYYNLARLDLRRGDYRGAIEKLDEAASQNGKFADIPAFQAAAYRSLGEYEHALEAAERAMQLDPLHFMGGYEKILAFKNRNASLDSWNAIWLSIMRDAVQNYLELAVAYANAGLYVDADAVLALYADGKNDANINPMINYYRGYFKELIGDPTAASSFYGKARKGPVDLTNPHRLEGKAALEAAIRTNPNDANAHLFLGNLLYAGGQREEGFANWRKAAELNDRLVHAWRNVAYAERHLKNDKQASYQTYKKAQSLNPDDARILLEMDQRAEDIDVPAAERLAILERYPTVVNSRDDLLSRWIDLSLASDNPEYLQSVYDKLGTHHFHSWEGQYGIHYAWVEVNQKLGDLAFLKDDYAFALHYYEEACKYPKNLEVAARTPDLRAHVYWNLAKVYLARNEKEQAADYLRQIVAERYNRPHLGTLYRALAYRALSNQTEYENLLKQLEENAKQRTSGEYRYRGDSQTIGHYLLSLIYTERGDQVAAAEELKKALERDPRVMRIAIREAQLDFARAHQ